MEKSSFFSFLDDFKFSTNQILSIHMEWNPTTDINVLSISPLPFHILSFQTIAFWLVEKSIFHTTLHFAKFTQPMIEIQHTITSN